jgi:hypothetical protein
MEGTKREKKPLTLSLSQGERELNTGCWVILHPRLPDGGEGERGEMVAA